LKPAFPIPIAEFIERRKNLAKALLKEEIDAFILEPGYTFQYYGNISQTDWEPWEPEERPFLMVIRPLGDEKGNVSANITFLAPRFEMERVGLLGIPFDRSENGEEIHYVGYEEHWDPYVTLFDSWGANNRRDIGRPKVMVDEEMRDFIQRGLNTNGFEVKGLGGEVEMVRQRKSPNEIEILRAVNTGTVEAIRVMRTCLYEGLKESEVVQVLDETIRAGGMEPFFDIVLFGKRLTFLVDFLITRLDSNKCNR
jgi:Xaa-Pro aminopeptidase